MQCHYDNSAETITYIGIKNQVVPRARLELARRYSQRGILNPLCLPIPPPGPKIICLSSLS